VIRKLARGGRRGSPHLADRVEQSLAAEAAEPASDRPLVLVEVIGEAGSLDLDRAVP
jgi:hypothetical protein